MTSRRLLPFLLALTCVFAAGAVRAEDESALGADVKPAEKPSKKKTVDKKKKKAGYDYDRSKYKSMDQSPKTLYRFDEKGDPVLPKEKKDAKKKKKRSEPPEAEIKPESTDTCGGDDSCTEKKRSESDAL